MGSATSVARLFIAARARRREQWLSPQRLTALQQERLRSLAAVAAGSPYYGQLFHRLGLGPQDWRTPATLGRLPLLDKATLQSRGDELVPARVQPPTVRIVTSGSTGQPLRLLRTARDQAQVSALWARLLHAYGRRPFDRQVNIASGRPVAAQGPAALLRRLGALHVYQLSAFDPPEEQVALLRRMRPQIISAYGIALELAAEAVLAAGEHGIRPRVVYTSGTALSARGRAAAQQAFGVQPLDVYAANEVGPIAWECPSNRGALHLNDDAQVVEIVDEDGQPVAVGQTGEVVVTQLLCITQPLLRYRLGDMARVIPGPCSCGRGLALLSPVLGRTLHTIRARDGRVLNSVMVSSMFGPLPEVRRYQVRQTAADELLVLIVPGVESPQAALDAVTRALGQRIGDAFRCRVELVETIPLARSGKFQTVVPLGTEPVTEPVDPVRRRPTE